MDLECFRRAARAGSLEVREKSEAEFWRVGPDPNPTLSLTPMVRRNTQTHARGFSGKKASTSLWFFPWHFFSGLQMKIESAKMWHKFCGIAVEISLDTLTARKYCQSKLRHPPRGRRSQLPLPTTREARKRGLPIVSGTTNLPTQVVSSQRQVQCDLPASPLQGMGQPHVIPMLLVPCPRCGPLAAHRCQCVLGLGCAACAVPIDWRAPPPPADSLTPDPSEFFEKCKREVRGPQASIANIQIQARQLVL